MKQEKNMPTVAPESLAALETALWDAGQACWVVGDVAIGEGIEVR